MKRLFTAGVMLMVCAVVSSVSAQWPTYVVARRSADRRRQAESERAGAAHA